MHVCISYLFQLAVLVNPVDRLTQIVKQIAVCDLEVSAVAANTQTYPNTDTKANNINTQNTAPENKKRLLNKPQ